MLKDEVSLTTYMNSKINEHSSWDLVYIVIATLLTTGILRMLVRFFKPTGFLESLSDEVLNGIPGAIYFFGSSVTGVIIAAAIFVQNHPDKNNPTLASFVLEAAMFGLMIFIYGYAISYGLKYKK